VDETALKFQPEPIQWYSNDDGQNGENDDYLFDLPEHLTELIRLRDGHGQIPLNLCDFFKSFSCSLRLPSWSAPFPNS
jgi:hypothetical protein